MGNNKLNKGIWGNSATSSAEETGNSIGKMLMSGLGTAMDENSYIAVTSMQNICVKLENLSKDSLKNQLAYEKKYRERQVSNLKNAKALEIISEREYYDTLKRYRDTYIEQGTDAWYKYTEEIISYNKRMADEAEAEQRKAEERQRELAATVASLRNDLERRLKSEDSPWYEYQNVILRGVGEFGSDQSYSYTNISDFDDRTRQLKEYRDAILKLAEIADMPKAVFADIAEMSVSDGLKAANAILNADEEALKRFTEGYKGYELTLSEVSSQLNPYLNYDKLHEAGIGSAEAFNNAYFDTQGTEKNEFITLLESSFDEVPQSYYDLGRLSAEGFGDGFGSEIGGIMDAIRSEMIGAMSAIAAELAAKASSVGMKAVGSGNTYKTTYNFNSSQDTTTGQLLAARNADTLARLRSGA